MAGKGLGMALVSLKHSMAKKQIAKGIYLGPIVSELRCPKLHYITAFRVLEMVGLGNMPSLCFS